MRYLLLLFVFIVLPFAGTAQIITTYAGNGTMGIAGNGIPAVNAELEPPKGLYLDHDGNLLIAANVLVRKVDKNTHIISTVAGCDTVNHPWDGRPALEAGLSDPYDICMDSVGNMYITDYYWNARKIDAVTGIIDTFAGRRQVGNSGDGGPAKLAKFNSMGMMDIDVHRNYVYIGDVYNHRVRRVSLATGIIDSFAGNAVNGYGGDGGPAVSAKFSRIMGIAVDKNGNVFIGDWDNARIRKVDVNTGIVSTVVGNGTLGYGGDGGPALNAMINKTAGICFDKYGDMYLTDQLNHRVRKINMATGIITTIAGNGVAGFSGDGGPALNASFNNPAGICIDTAMNLYIADYSNYRIRTFKLQDVTPESVKQMGLKQTVNIYPNPATDHIGVELKDNWQDAQLSIISLQGQELMQAQCKPGTTQLNTQALPSGTYFIKITDQQSGQTVVQPLLKQ